MEIKHSLKQPMDQRKKRENGKVPEKNENGNNIPELINAEKVVLRRKFIAINAYMKKDLK